MGTALSTAADGLGTLLGNAVAAPIKTIFGGSCEGVCLGTWDVSCFIEHLCFSKLIKLVMVMGLCYITLLFFYLLYKVGICRCVVRSLCKMCWAACETYWLALGYISCFLCRKLANVKRVNRRRRFRSDAELGHSSSEESTNSNIDQNVFKRKKMLKKKRITTSSGYPLRQVSRNRYAACQSRRRRHSSRMKTKDVSIHVQGRSQGLKHSRQLHMRNLNSLRREDSLKKRRSRY